jgi:hypothetical protein
MGLTDIFIVKYKDVKKAYNTLFDHLSKPADTVELRDQAIERALRETIEAMDKGIKRLMMDNETQISYQDPNTEATVTGTPKKYYDKLFKKMSDELKNAFYARLEDAYAQRDPRLAAVKTPFKERKQGIVVGLVAEILPNFFKNLCRQLDKLKRHCLGKPLKPEYKLEEIAEKMVKEMNKTMRRDIGSLARKRLIEAASAAGSAAAGLVRTAAQLARGKGSTPSSLGRK